MDDNQTDQRRPFLYVQNVFSLSSIFTIAMVSSLQYSSSALRIPAISAGSV